MNKVRSPRRKSKELLPDKATIHSYKSSTAGLLLLRKMPIGCGVSTLCSQNVLVKVLFTYEYTWQNFRLRLLCLINRLYTVIHKTKKS